MYIHGHCQRGWQSKAFITWSSLIRRCKNKADPDYGGRGISVCARWKQFKNFLEDMGNPPMGTIIDRINNNGNYTPSNCQWVTRALSNLNTRRNVRLRFKGVTKTIKQWADTVGISSETIRARLKYGWSTAEALSQAVRGNVWIECFGKRQILKDWAREVKIPQQTIKHRLNKGWSIKAALTKRPRRSRWSVCKTTKLLKSSS